MNFLSFAALPPWAAAISLAVHFFAGVLLGRLYFRGLQWNVRLFAEGGRVASSIAVLVGRFVLLGGALTLASLEGAWPLLVMTAGFLLARHIVMRRVRNAAA